MDLQPKAGYKKGRRSSLKKSGFTLIEVLVATGIIAALGALAAMGTSAIFEKARKTREVAAARHLVRTYLNVAADDNGKLMMLTDTRFSEHDKDEVNPRWTSRMKDYLGKQYRDTLYVNRQAELYDHVLRKDPYQLTLYSTFGLNAQFVGGTSPTSGDAIRQITHAENPSKLIVFASASNNQYANLEHEYGFWRIEAPQIAGWGRGSQHLTPIESTRPFDILGYVAFRYHNETVVAYLDGRVATVNVEELRDMRYWSNQALVEDNPDFRPKIRH